MSTQKVKKLKRVLNYVATWAAGLLTVTTDATHYLKSTDKVNLIFNNSPCEFNQAVVTVTTPSEFTIEVVSQHEVQMIGKVIIDYFSDSQTGEISTFSIAKTMDSPSVIQFTAHGTGGAVLVLSVSNDGEGWVEIATVTLASSNLASEFVSIAPQWTKAKLSATSIGTDTTVTVTVVA